MLSQKEVERLHYGLRSHIELQNDIEVQALNDLSSKFILRTIQTGESLWDIYFKDPITGEPRAFQAREKVTGGRILRATYCPEHLHLYHLLTKWERAEQEEEGASTSSLKSRLNKGVSMVTVPVAGLAGARDNTPPQLNAYQPFFDMIKKDNIPVVRLKNAMGENEQTIVIFDMRQFQTGSNSRIITDANISAPPLNMDLPTPSATMGLSELLSQTAPPPLQVQSEELTQ